MISQLVAPEEIVYHEGWIRADDVLRLAQPLLKNAYGQYLIHLLQHEVLV